MVWYGVVRCGMVWYSVVWCDMVWYSEEICKWHCTSYTMCVALLYVRVNINELFLHQITIIILHMSYTLCRMCVVYSLSRENFSELYRMWVNTICELYRMWVNTICELYRMWVNTICELYRPYVRRIHRIWVYKWSNVRGLYPLTRNDF